MLLLSLLPHGHQMSHVWVQSQWNEPKRCQMGPKNNQDWKNIYVLPFKTMVIMAKLVIFQLYECQRIQTKNPFNKI